MWWLGIPMDVAVDQMKARLGSKRTVYWVNLWFGDVGYANYDRLPKTHAANRVLKQTSREYPNLRIIDFARGFMRAVAQGKPVGWLGGIHLNVAGY